MDEGDRHEDKQLELYGEVEGLCQEEIELLEIQEHERTATHHERLHAISQELDRIRARLHERDGHLGRR
jgi:hypothetical protein